MAPVCLSVLLLTLYVSSHRVFDHQVLLDIQISVVDLCNWFLGRYNDFHPHFSSPKSECVCQLPCCIPTKRKWYRKHGKRGCILVNFQKLLATSLIEMRNANTMATIWSNVGLFLSASCNKDILGSYLSIRSNPSTEVYRQNPMYAAVE